MTYFIDFPTLHVVKTFHLKTPIQLSSIQISKKTAYLIKKEAVYTILYTYKTNLKIELH